MALCYAIVHKTHKMNPKTKLKTDASQESMTVMNNSGTPKVIQEAKRHNRG